MKPVIWTREEVAVAVGSALRERRRAAGLTQEQLAERSGLSERGVRQLEGADRVPSFTVFLQLSQGLTLPVAELASDVERLLLRVARRRS